MPRNDQDAGREVNEVSSLGAGHADPTQAIDRICATLLAIDASLSPIIGARGVAALYQRSLHMAAAQHPWLVELHDGEPPCMDLTPLRLALARQSAAGAVAAGELLVQTLCQLLTSLIGPSLSERLLRSARTGSSHDGLGIDEILPDQEGFLGGRPTRRQRRALAPPDRTE